jgi:parallel beta-helix repeat protein
MRTGAAPGAGNVGEEEVRMIGSLDRRRLKSGLSLAAIAAVALLVGVGQGLAKGKTNVVCGQVITKSIRVANDLTNCPGDGLVIGADKVKVDLGGHVIDGVNAAGSDGIRNSGGFDDVRIEHGTVQQFSTGVDLVNATKNRIEHLTVQQSNQNGNRGIGLVGSSNNTIDHDTVTANYDGIHLSASDGNEIGHDDVSASLSSAIVLISGSDGNKVDHNRAHDNPAWGITSDFSTNNTYDHNKVFDNHIAGIEPFHGSGIHVDHNDLSGNTIGIEFFTTSNSFVTNNNVQSSTHDGIHTFQGSTGNLVRGNHSNRNGADGIDTADAGNTITKNHANKNATLGIFAAVGNTDGGGNKASGNGTASQCVGVTCKK